ncbi:MAG: nitroreductase family protein [Pseudomonadota bacterium]
MNVSDALKTRLSANVYDTRAEVTKEQIIELVELATEAPSSFNSQNWKVIAVTDPEVRKQVRAAAWDQAKVTDSAVLFAVLGNTNVTERLGDAMDLATNEGIVDTQTKEWFETNAAGFYKDKPQLARDEALRSASYLAMSLMLAGQEKGFGSGPMIGFDPDKVSEVLKVPDNWVVTVLISMGPLASEGNWKRKPRLKDVISFDTF